MLFIIKRHERGSYFLYVSEKVRTSKRELEIDDPKPPKKRKVSSHSKEGETAEEFVSTVDAVKEHYHQIFISAEILHRKLLRQWKYCFYKRCMKKISVMLFSNIFAF